MTALSETTEQRELRQAVRAFLDGRSLPRADVDPTSAFSPTDATWRAMADQMGLQGIHLPVTLGGSGGSFVELGIVLEELGRVLYDGPYLASTALAATTLLVVDDAEAAGRHLPGIAAGQTVATTAIAGSDPWARVTAHGTTWEARLTGRLDLVIDGASADLLLVPAQSRHGPALYAVEGDAPGLSRKGLPTLDPTRRLAAVDLDETPATHLGAPGEGERLLPRIRDLAGVALACEQVGSASRLLEDTVRYVTERVQYGRPIGSFQAVKHACADMLVRVEQARSAALVAAEAAANDRPELAVLASVARAVCSDAHLAVAGAAVQLHGAIAYTWEHHVHLHLKRAATSAQLFGSPAEHRELVLSRLGI